MAVGRAGHSHWSVVVSAAVTSCRQTSPAAKSDEPDGARPRLRRRGSWLFTPGGGPPHSLLMPGPAEEELNRRGMPQLSFDVACRAVNHRRASAIDTAARAAAGSWTLRIGSFRPPLCSRSTRPRRFCISTRQIARSRSSHGRSHLPAGRKRFAGADWLSGRNRDRGERRANRHFERVARARGPVGRLLSLVVRQYDLGDLVGEPCRADFVQVLGMELGVKPQSRILA